LGGAIFHHYVDINLTGDTDVNTPQRKTRTVDGLKPSQFPGGGITTLSPSALQLASWAPTVMPAGATAIEIVPTSCLP